MLAILITICGLWALITGKVPSALFGGKDYRIEGTGARIVGGILVLHFPLSMVGGFLLGLFMGQRGVEYALILDVVILVVVFITALIVSRMVRKPVAAM